MHNKNDTHIKVCNVCLLLVPSNVPQNVVAVPLNATHAMIVWEPPPPDHQNGLIGLYRIAITVVDTDEQLQDVSAGTTTVLGPLHPFYTYKFSIAAETVQVGPFTSPITLKMPEAGNVSFIRFEFPFLFFPHSSNWNCKKYDSRYCICQLCKSVLASSECPVLEWPSHKLRCYL